MTEATIVARQHHPKVKRWTRRMLLSSRVAIEKEKKLASKAARRGVPEMRQAEREALLPFRGCDPARTLALIGEDA